MMRKWLFVSLAVPIIFSSCSTETDIADSGEQLKAEKIQKAKAFVSGVQFKLQVSPGKNQSLRSVFKVTPVELQSLLSSGKRLTATKSIIRSLEPVIYKNDTIMYLVNYAKGWKLYSVDKRMPLILAENFVETGKKAADILQNKNIDFWISDIATLTKQLSQTDEYDVNSESLETWAGQGSTSGIQRIPTQPVPGEYIYVGMEEISRTTVFCPHVTKTLWHGEEPFNTYCPLYYNNGDIHAPAGCVAVSSAQYLYFLQDKLGYTFQMPLSGSCSGNLNAGYTQTFTGFANWDLSKLSLTDNTSMYTPAQFNNVALAIGYVGKQTDMQYGKYNSYSNYDKAQTFLNKVGVKGKFVKESDIDLNNIIFAKKHPVLTRGTFDNANSGHMFLIDGGKYDLVEYEYIWRFLEDTTFYDPDRYGVILRESAGTFKENYRYQCNLGYNASSYTGGYDGDDTYYLITNIQNFNTERKYFKRED